MVELGYVLLEECRGVDVAAECPLNEWTSVEVIALGDEVVGEARIGDACGDGTGNGREEGACGDETLCVVSQHYYLEASPSSCCGCNVPIQCRRRRRRRRHNNNNNNNNNGGDDLPPVQKQHQQQQLFVDCQALDPFHGQASEVRCGRCQTVRSDFSLLLGLVRANTEVVSIQTIQVLVSTEKKSTMYALVTLAFPNMPHHRSILPAPTNSTTKMTTTKKSMMPLLPTPMRTLLMILESNWTRLQETMEHLAIPRRRRSKESWKQRKEPSSLFPTQLTISELCQRLENSDSSPYYPTTTTNRVDGPDDDNDNDNDDFLLHLPPDLWSATLVPFLTTADVDALRNSCRTLRHVLRATVPGLKLRLYHHQVESLRWMRERERANMTEREILQRPSSDDDANLHRAVTGGVTVQLQSRDSSLAIRLDAITGCEYTCPPSVIRRPRNVVRGGMLCDDPGLGKTITVIALILQSGASDRPTAVRREVDCDPDLVFEGIDEEATDSPSSKVESVRHDNIFYTYWEEEVAKEFRFQDSLKLLNGFLRRASGVVFPVKQVRLALSNDVHGSDFRNFEVGIRSLIETSNDEPVLYLNLWENMVDEFKESQMRSVRRYFSNSASKPRSNVAAMLADENKERLGRSLIPSSSTLLVVPSVLLDHWQSQIEQHVDWKYCTDKTPYTFEFLPKTSKERLSEAMSMLEEGNHSPVLFVDRAGASRLPDAKFLAQFRIVITTTQRFKNEWKKGSFQEEILHRDSGTTSNYRHLADQISDDTYKSCELLKINWKRMIIDEGHSMGNKGSSTIQFASWIQASRRWVMTGTPTKQSGVEINQLLNLLNFLQHGFFTPCLDGDTHWKRHIAREWTDGNLGSFFRLRSLLGYLMKRHTKLDIKELLPPEYETTKVPMSTLEVATYNTVVAGIQANILLTSMDAKTSGLQDSLLHRSQAKSANLALLNIRRVCTGWSRVVPLLRDDHYELTIRMAENFGFSRDQITNVKKYIHRAESEQQSECGVCAFRVPIHILMSCCGGLVCTECMTSNTTSCLICDKQFDPDELQEFQPGFANDWKLNIVYNKLQKISNVIALSASADSPNHATVPGLPTPRPMATRRPDDGHVCQFDPFRGDGFGCILCWRTHDECNFMNAKSQCEVCYAMAEICPEDESKSFYLIDKLLKLHQSSPPPLPLPQKVIADKPGEGCRRPLKAIVFSQFRKTLDFIGDRLLKRFGAGCIAEYFGSHRKRELRKFACDPACFCLLLTKDGSEGLDLSFVTNIFFLDEIYDKSLREQAVARAWRMGAQGSVKVETLVAKNSIEETMGEMDAVNQSDSFADAGKAPPERERRKLLLTSLKLNTDYHYFASSEGKEPDRLVVPASATTKRKHVALVSDDDASVVSSRAKRVRFCLCDDVTWC